MAALLLFRTRQLFDYRPYLWNFLTIRHLQMHNPKGNSNSFQLTRSYHYNPEMEQQDN